MEEKVMKDCKVLALCSQKGGVGKTTSCVNLAVGLAKAGKKVLVIDNDPQGSMTASLGYHNPERCKQTQSQNPNKTKKDNRKLKFKAFSPLVFSFGKMRGLFSALSINSDWRK